MLIIIYSNCQFDGIKPNLKKNVSNIEIYAMENFAYIRKRHELPKKKLVIDIFNSFKNIGYIVSTHLK